MKNFLCRTVEVVKMILNFLMGALYFIKIDHDIAVLPNPEGDLARVDYYYSIFDKLLRENLQFLIWIALAVTAVSVLLSILVCVVKDNQKLKIASHVIFGISASFFLALFCYGMQIRYNY